MTNKILVVCAHPDDETLGCGGTLLAHRHCGDTLHWLIASSAYEPRWSPTAITAKDHEINRVQQAYAMASCHRLGFPAARLDTIALEELILGIDTVITLLKPHRVYVVHGGDVHSDHRRVFQATMAVLKPFRQRELGVREIMAYETLSSTDAAPAPTQPPFSPTVFHDITAHLENKLAIMAMYASEAQDTRQPRSPSAIQALARLRGATIATDYAEAFMLIRSIGAPL